MVSIERVGRIKNALGESPIWDASDQALYWVDSTNPAIFHYQPGSGEVQRWELPALVGCLALRESGGVILACEDGIFSFDFDTGERKFIVNPEPDRQENRLNDGKVDPRGRFLVGSMHRQFPVNRDPHCALYRLDPDHQIHRIADGIVLSNGPCWSPDGATMYLVDSGIHAMYAYDYDLDSGTVANRRLLFQTNFPEEGAPDGCTVDAEGCIWTALIMSGHVARYSPDGEPLDRIEVPPNRVTSLTFGGPDLDILYITSMGRALASGPDPSEPGAGGVFAIHGLGVNGLPEHRFAG